MFNKSTYDAKKSTVHTVIHQTSRNMEKLIKINRDFVASDALKHIFGKSLTIKNIVSRAGLNYGLMRLILYGNYVFFPDTVNQNYIALRITGLIVHLKKLLISQDVSILSMMGLIFIRKDALSV
jgi:hypothetical protein